MLKFWTNASGSLRFDPEALHEFLKQNGFGRYKAPDIQGTLLIRVIERTIQIVSAKEIRRFCWDYINDYNFQDPEERKQVKYEFQKQRSFFSKDNLDLIDLVEINEIKDTEDTSYLFFKNCVVKISKDGIIRLNYNEITGHVFEKEIIDFSIDTQDWEDYSTTGEFFWFMLDICRGKDNMTEDNNLESLMSILGYLLHRYKNPSFSKSVIFMDPFKGDMPNGGTGKTLLTHAFEKIRCAVFEDGKFFNSRDRFVMSQVDYDTRILVLDDVPQNFDFERIFPVITERVVVDRKYKDKFTIKFERCPKFVITTNYTIEGEGFSFTRRKIEFVLSNYYNTENKPDLKFGHLLFDDWDKEEWESFYVLIANCILQFLLFGITEQNFNVSERALQIEAHPKFIEFMDTNITSGTKYNKKEVYDKFYLQNPGVAKIEMTTFRRWLKLYAGSKNYKFKESHSGYDNFFEYSKE